MVTGEKRSNTLGLTRICIDSNGYVSLHVVSRLAKFIVGGQQDGRLKALRIQLIGDEDASVDEDEGGIGRWREYVASYVTKHPTEWISTSDGKKMGGGEPFLSRCVAVTELQAAGKPKAILGTLFPARRKGRGSRAQGISRCGSLGADTRCCTRLGRKRPCGG